MSSSSSDQQQGGSSGFLGALIKPGWDAAERVLPILHRCLAALLAVLLYTAQHNPGPLRTHLLCMAGLTVGLWASVAWFVGEYRRALAQAKAAESGGGEGSAAAAATAAVAAPAPAAVGGGKPVRYTD